MIRFYPVAIALLLASPFASAQSCEFERIETNHYDLDTITNIHVDARAGELEVQGDDVKDLVVRLHACAQSQAVLDDMALDVGPEGSTLSLKVLIPSSLFGADHAYMDLEIQLPVDQRIVIDDTSGDILINDAAVTRISDSSGNIRGRNLRTDLTVRDSSGEINLRSVSGTMTIKDSSGNINLRGITGDVHIIADSSGDITIEDTGGLVRIDQDGSGEIEIDTAREVNIGSDGSGGIEIEQITGDVHVGNDGSGSLIVRKVSGNLQVDNKGSGRIRTHDIDGTIQLP